MEKKSLQATIRTKISKASRSEIRKKGLVPGIVYSRQLQPVPVAVPENSINPLVFTSETHIINLKLDDKSEFDCLLKDVQFDPVTDKVVHFDLQAIISGEKMEVEIPVILKGNPVGVRDGGVLQHSLHKILIRCLPNEMPESVEVEVGHLKVGQSIHVSDLKFDQFEILTDEDTVVVAITHARGTEVTPVGEGEEKAEPEVIAKGKEKSAEE